MGCCVFTPGGIKWFSGHLKSAIPFLALSWRILCPFTDIDECLDTSACDGTASCSNTDPGYKCSCRQQGFVGGYPGLPCTGESIIIITITITRRVTAIDHSALRAGCCFDNVQPHMLCCQRSSHCTSAAMQPFHSIHHQALPISVRTSLERCKARHMPHY